MFFLLLWITVSQTIDINKFRAIQAFRCDFAERTGRASSAQGEPSLISAPEPLKGLVTHSIDYSARSALSSTEGGPGAVAVALAIGNRSTTFLMTSVDGNPMLKTVFASPRPANAPIDILLFFPGIPRTSEANPGPISYTGRVKHRVREEVL